MTKKLCRDKGSIAAPNKKMATMGRTFEYYPSSPFLPSVALGTLLTTKRLALKMLIYAE